MFLAATTLPDTYAEGNLYDRLGDSPRHVIG